MDQLSSCHLKALVSLAGGYRLSSSSRATLLEAVSSELQSVNGKTWHVSNCKQLSPHRVFGGLVFFGGKFWVYGEVHQQTGPSVSHRQLRTPAQSALNQSTMLCGLTVLVWSMGESSTSQLSMAQLLVAHEEFLLQFGGTMAQDYGYVGTSQSHPQGRFPCGGITELPFGDVTADAMQLLLEWIYGNAKVCNCFKELLDEDGLEQLDEHLASYTAAQVVHQPLCGAHMPACAEMSLCPSQSERVDKGCLVGVHCADAAIQTCPGGIHCADAATQTNGGSLRKDTAQSGRGLLAGNAESAQETMLRNSQPTTVDGRPAVVIAHGAETPNSPVPQKDVMEAPGGSATGLLPSTNSPQDEAQVLHEQPNEDAPVLQVDILLRLQVTLPSSIAAHLIMLAAPYQVSQNERESCAS
ncbi:hypothetical protein WJX82_009840 [Trebouxia sp. C0006]